MKDSLCRGHANQQRAKETFVRKSHPVPNKSYQSDMVSSQ